MNSLKLVYMSPGELADNPANWRLHPESQTAALGDLIGQVGWAGACLFNERTQRLIDGHARKKIAIERGEQSIPVIVGDWSEEDERTILATLDPLAAMAGADGERLQALLDSVSVQSAEASKMLEELERKHAVKREVIEDEVPDPPADLITKPGDLWILGSHRLLCGDSTKAEDVERLMGGAKADCAVIDPPFELADKLWTNWIMDPCVIFGQARHIRKVPDELWRFERIILKKYRHRSATVQIDHRHAFVVQCGSIKTLPGNKETFASVVEQEIDREHNHAKPVSLIVEHLTQWMGRWAIVIDPFAGGGSTIIAAEVLNRSCYAIEKDPAFCDVIIKRWEKFTAKQANLLE